MMILERVHYYRVPSKMKHLGFRNMAESPEVIPLDISDFTNHPPRHYKLQLTAKPGLGFHARGSLMALVSQIDGSCWRAEKVALL